MEKQDVNSMEENRSLQQLVRQARSHPDRSAQRRIALNRLIIAIRHSPSLKKPDNLFNIPNYQDIYDEALNTTCMEIHRRIDSYNSEHPVMAWVNYILNFRIQDAIAKERKKGLTDLPKSCKPDWWEIDRSFGEDDNRSMDISTPNPRDEDCQSLKNLIADDPDGKFAERHIQNLPAATFQNICLMQLEGKKWKEIAACFGTSIPTISGFYRTSLNLLLPYIRQSLDVN
jgi:DNA-directed RNA polymerase specialized sigma24 family protein